MNFTTEPPLNTQPQNQIIALPQRTRCPHFVANSGAIFAVHSASDWLAPTKIGQAHDS
jgi:hypothetical protein